MNKPFKKKVAFFRGQGKWGEKSREGRPCGAPLLPFIRRCCNSSNTVCFLE